MSASVALTGLTAADPRPGNFLQINFAVGQVSGSQGTRAALLIGNMLPAGDATAATKVYGPVSDPPAQTEDDVIARVGAGSELHRMWRAFTKNNKSTPVYLMPTTQSAGAAATLAVTLTGTATTAGTVRVFVGTHSVDVAVASGDTATVVAASITAAVNANVNWPVTASTASGTLTFTAKQLGLRGNFLRASVAVIAGAGITSTAALPAYFTGGTTEDDWTTALATLATKSFYYNVSASNTAGLTALVAQVSQQQLPLTGIRERVFAGSNGTSSSAITIATALNAARLEIVRSEESDWTPAEIAAHAAGAYALEELGTVPRHNFSGYGNDPATALTWLLPAPRSGKAPTPASLLADLNNGVTPIGVTAQGGTYIVKRITSRSLSGANADYRIRDAHRVTETDFFADDLLAKLSLQFAGCDLLADLGPTDIPPDNPRWTCPRFLRNAIVSLIDVYAGRARMKNAAAVKAGLVVQISSGNPNAVEIRVPFQNIDILDKTMTALDQVA
jgi:phage tail sheath gpL-like